VLLRKQGARLRLGDLADQFALRIAHSFDLSEKDELVGVERDRGGCGNILHAQMEGFTGGGEAKRGKQHHRAMLKSRPDTGAVHLADQTSVLEVGAVDDTQRPRTHKVSGYYPDCRVGHRGIGQSLRERRLDVEADLAGCFLEALECWQVGDTDAVCEASSESAQAQLLLDLRSATVDHDDLDTERAEQPYVLDQCVETTCLDKLAWKPDHEAALSKVVDVGCNRAEPGNELTVVQGLPGSGLVRARDAFEVAGLIGGVFLHDGDFRTCAGRYT